MLKLRDWVNIDKIEWFSLSYNQNAVELLKENQDKIDWEALSFNKNAIELLKKKQDIINNKQDIIIALLDKHAS